MKNKSIIYAISLIMLLGVFLAGCATIVTGTKQLVTITSNVEGATVYLDGIKIGETPFAGEIKKNGKVITIEKEGYKKYTLALSTSIEGVFFGNIITGGTLGSITDFASGAAYKYTPASFQVELIADGLSLNEFRRNYELKKFAMVNMSNISIDLSNNSGQYLNSLLFLANLEANDNSLQIIKDNILKSNGDQVVFGNLMVKLIAI